jgi:hypothetical protein
MTPIKKLLDEARSKLIQELCGKYNNDGDDQRLGGYADGIEDGFDAAAAIIEELVEELKFYAERRHALFTEEQRQDDGLIRTRVDSVVETGWRARQALARATERLESMRGKP